MKSSLIRVAAVVAAVLALAAGVAVGGIGGGERPADGGPAPDGPPIEVVTGKTVAGTAFSLFAFDTSRGWCLRLGLGSNPLAAESCGDGVPSVRPFSWTSFDDAERGERILFGAVTRAAARVRASVPGAPDAVVDTRPIHGANAAAYVISLESDGEPLAVALTAEDAGGEPLAIEAARFARLDRPR